MFALEVHKSNEIVRSVTDIRIIGCLDVAASKRGHLTLDSTVTKCVTRKPLQPDFVPCKWSVTWPVGLIYQGFLKKYIWPWGKWSAVSHDSYTCGNFPRTRAFPTERDITVTSNFVASVISANDIMKEKCPYKCRPSGHKDWEYC